MDLNWYTHTKEMFQSRTARQVYKGQTQEDMWRRINLTSAGNLIQFVFQFCSSSTTSSTSALLNRILSNFGSEWFISSLFSSIKYRVGVCKR